MVIVCLLLAIGSNAPPLRKYAENQENDGQTGPMLSHNPTMVVTHRHHTPNTSVCISRERSHKLFQTRQSRSHSSGNAVEPPIRTVQPLPA